MLDIVVRTGAIKSTLIAGMDINARSRDNASSDQAGSSIKNERSMN